MDNQFFKFGYTFLENELYNEEETTWGRASKHIDIHEPHSDILYSQQGLMKQVEWLQLQLLQARKGCILITMNNLTLTYSQQECKGGWGVASSTLRVNEDSVWGRTPHHVEGHAQPHFKFNIQYTMMHGGMWAITVLSLTANEESAQGGVLTIMNSLVLTYSQQGCVKEVKQLEFQFLEASERLLGAEYLWSWLMYIQSTRTHKGDCGITASSHSIDNESVQDGASTHIDDHANSEGVRLKSGYINTRWTLNYRSVQMSALAWYCQRRALHCFQWVQVMIQ